MKQDIRQALFERIMDTDRGGARLLVAGWAGRYGYDRVVGEVLEPVLRRFGEGWASEKEVSLAQGYMCGRIAEDIMLGVLEHTPAVSVENQKGSVVIGNIQDDFHELGRRLVGIFLKANGWQVIDLGTSPSGPILSSRRVRTSSS